MAISIKRYLWILLVLIIPFINASLGYDNPNLPKLNGIDVITLFDNNTAFVNASSKLTNGTLTYTVDDLVPYVGAFKDVDLGNNNLTVGGTVAVGDAIPNPNTLIMASSDFSGAPLEDIFGMQFIPVLSSSSSVFGVVAYPSDKPDAIARLGMTGFLASPQINHTGGTTASVVSYNSFPFLNDNSAGTITSMAHFLAADPIVNGESTETISSLYGIILGEQTKGDINWQIFSFGGDWALDGDNDKIFWGEGQDYSIEWDGSDAVHNITAGDFVFTGGDVGIGTAGPAKSLHVNSAGTNVVARFESTDTISQLEIQDDDDIAYVGTKDSVAFLGMVAGSTTENLIVDTSGNVGIGTTGPGYLLDIKESTSSTNTAQPQLRIIRKSSGDMVDDFGTGIVFGIQDNVSTEKIIAEITGIRDGADGSGAIKFRTYSGGTPSEQMRITSAGNVGIGTASPVSTIHMYQDDATVDKGLTLEQDGVGDSTIQFLLTAAERFIVGLDNSDGNKFKIGEATSLGTNDLLIIDPATDDVYIPQDNEKLMFGAGQDCSIRYDGTDMIINPKDAGSGDLIVNGSLNVTNNFTGNQIYGEMWNRTVAASPYVITIGAVGIYYNVTGLLEGMNNGFSYTANNQSAGGSFLTAQVSGRYRATASVCTIVGTASGDLYGYAISHEYNRAGHNNCYARRTAVNKVGCLPITCFIDVPAGTDVNLQIEQETGGVARDISIQTANLNLVRMGDIL